MRVSRFFGPLAATVVLFGCSSSDAPSSGCAECEDTGEFGVILPDGAPAATDIAADVSDRPRATIEEALSALNAQRAASGLEPVVLDDDLTAGCVAHIDYMVGEQKVVHEQDPTSAFYSTRGAETGPRALIAGDVFDLQQAIELWTAVLYHRVALLDSGTQDVGFAFRDGYACLDTFGKWTAENAIGTAAYPGNGQIGVPTTLSPDISPLTPVPADWETPNGTVISLSFPPESVLEDDATLEVLSVSSGALVDGIIRRPNDPTDPYASFLGNTLALVPRSPLRDDTTYRVELNATIDGESVNRIWQFTTAPAP